MGHENDLVFPGPKGEVLSDAAIGKLLREVLEAALAYSVGSQVERSHARTDHFDRRAEVTAEWARYLGR